MRVVLGAVRPGKRRHDRFYWRHGHADGPPVVAHHPVTGAAHPERTPPTSAAVRAQRVSRELRRLGHRQPVGRGQLQFHIGLRRGPRLPGGDTARLVPRQRRQLGGLGVA